MRAHPELCLPLGRAHSPSCSSSVTGHTSKYVGYNDFNPPSWPSQCAPDKESWNVYPGAAARRYPQEFWNCSDMTIEGACMFEYTSGRRRLTLGRVHGTRRSRKYPPSCVFGNVRLVIDLFWMEFLLVIRLASVPTFVCGRSNSGTDSSSCGTCVVFQEAESTDNILAAPSHM